MYEWLIEPNESAYGWCQYAGSWSSLHAVNKQNTRNKSNLWHQKSRGTVLILRVVLSSSSSLLYSWTRKSDNCFGTNCYKPWVRISIEAKYGAVFTFDLITISINPDMVYTTIPLSCRPLWCVWSSAFCCMVWERERRGEEIGGGWGGGLYTYEIFNCSWHLFLSYIIWRIMYVDITWFRQNNTRT